MCQNFLPYAWSPRPENPLYRGMGYDRFRLTNLSPHWLRDMAWKIRPSMSRVPIAKEFWRDTYPPLDTDTHDFWIEQTGIIDDEELRQHFYGIRDAAWQVVQEFTIARWWFLRSIMAKSPYYDELRGAASQGATVIDLGCGFGQDLRRLKTDGATGDLFGVDSRPKLWELGSKLFSESKNEKEKFQFRNLHIHSDFTQAPPENPLAEFTDKADIYLLNDLLSFLGGKHIQGATDSIHRASKVGTKVFGWLIGQEGEVSGINSKENGDGYRGCILTLKSVQQLFGYPNYVDPKIKWDVKAQLVDFKSLGFDEEDQKWFESDIWDAPDGTSDRPNKLAAIFFCAVRTK